MLRSLIACASIALATLAIVLIAQRNGETPRGEAWTVDPVEHILEGRKAKEPISVTFRLTNRSTSPLRILGEETC